MTINDAGNIVRKPISSDQIASSEQIACHPIVCAPRSYPRGALAQLSEHQAMLPRPFMINRLNWETGAGDIFTWELAPLDDQPYHFKPGQFNMLYCHGQGEVPISIAADCEHGPLIHTTRAVGGVTRGMAQLKIGDTVGVRGPFGSHWPIENCVGQDLIIMSGGLGLPPLRPVIYYILNHRPLYRRVFLLYGARTPLDLVYRAEVEAWRNQGMIDVLLTVDKSTGQWRDNIGVVPQLLNQVVVDVNNTTVMMCGPEVMMHFGQLALHKLGINDDQILVSMERNMKCAIGHCGHCQWGPHFICKSGPVYRFSQIRDWFAIHEL